MSKFAISDIRKDFPVLNTPVNNKSLVYLDSAATTLKPQVVADRVSHFLAYESSNVHRGAHFLSDQATRLFEESRTTVQKFIGAEFSEEIIFTKGTTESLNLIASSLRDYQKSGQNSFLDEDSHIVVTELEHHANLIPWQNLCQKTGAQLKFIPVTPEGDLDYAVLDQSITNKTKIVSFTGCSNTLGTFTQVDLIIKKAKSVGALVVLDAAQYVSQKHINVKLLDVDFLVFSAHKIFGPFGFGILYGKKNLLNEMPPYQFGGSMISEVFYESSTYNTLPFKFEAGTPNIEGAIGTSEALKYFNQFNLNDIFEHEQSLLKYASEELSLIPGVFIYAKNSNKAPIISFKIEGAHHADIGQLLDQMGIAVRVGHHCTQPLLKKFNVTGTVRASFSIYNNQNDIEQFITAVKKAQRMLV